jgi:hypothetical protein
VLRETASAIKRGFMTFSTGVLALVNDYDATYERARAALIREGCTPSKTRSYHARYKPRRAVRVLRGKRERREVWSPTGGGPYGSGPRVRRPSRSPGPGRRWEWTQTGDAAEWVAVDVGRY